MHIIVNVGYNADKQSFYHDKNLFHMSNKILSCKEWGGGANKGLFAMFHLPILALIMLLAESSKSYGQSTDCFAISNCSTSLKIEVVREFSNTSASCESQNLCGGGNRFYQMKYRVFLRYSANTPPANQQPFDLQYKRLNVTMGLDLLGTSAGGFSHIDELATMACYDSGPGANWSDSKVGFTVSRKEKTVDIDFMNTSTTNPCGTGDDAIHFTWGTPANLNMGSCTPSTYCAYAELFSIVVNAYPGESFRISQKISEFIPFDSELQQTCSPLALENSGTSNGNSSTTATDPMSHQGTINANLLAEILTPVTSNGNQKFEVRVRNSVATDIIIYYMEFMVQVAPSFPDVVLSYTGANSPDAIVGVVNNRMLHYRLTFPNGLTIAGMSSSTVGNIEVAPPNPTNQPWSVDVSLIESTKSRVRSRLVGTTSIFCTTLPLSAAVRNYTASGPAQCTSSPAFRVQPKNGTFDICSDSPAMIQVGFDQSDNFAIFKFNRLVFEIRFDLTDDLAISGVDFTDWANNWSCPTPIDPSCLDANSDEPCYDIIGDNVVRFCFSALTADAITIEGDNYINIMFNNEPGCIKKATITHLEVTPWQQVPCIPFIDNTLNNPVSAVCPPQIRGNIAMETGVDVEAVDVDLVLDMSTSSCIESSNCSGSSCPARDILTTKSGDFGFCIKDPCFCNCFTVIPTKDDNPLNGVTTFDLVLISKHILGLEPLNSPYKMIAADVNKSGSITTFDIVETRKLILGTYSEFPMSDSWRFVDKNFSFPNANNPFQTSFPEIKQGVSANANSAQDFIAVKTGDVNNTAVGNLRPSRRPSLPLNWPSFRATAGDVITVPVTYAGGEALEAFQLGLRYDPSVLELVSPSQGDLPGFDAGSVHVPYPGEIRSLWLNMGTESPDGHIAPGSTLFNLSFRVLGGPLPAELPMWLDDSVLYGAVWKMDGTECAVQYAPTASKRDAASVPESLLDGSVRPNPTSGEATLHVRCPEAGKARIVLTDAFGRWLGTRDVALAAGPQDVALPEAGSFPAGVYLWKVYFKGEEIQGHLIKQ